MDSQVTLIGSDSESEFAAPGPEFGTSTTLDFDCDVMKSMNATVRGQSHIQYSVRTVKGGLVGMNPKTIFSQKERILATVQRRGVLPDSLTLGSKSMSLSSWLKRPLFSSFPASFSEGGETYLWKECQDGGIALYKGSTSTSAIARFYPSYFAVTYDRRRITHCAHLDLEPEADLIREKVFISCVLVVQKTGKNAKAEEWDLELARQRLVFSYVIAMGSF